MVPEFSATIPFTRGAAEIIRWYDGDQSRRVIDPVLNQLLDEMIERYEKVGI